MAKNESESGTLHFTKTGYMRFVRSVRKEYNAYIATLRQAALDAHSRLAKLKPKERRAAFSNMKCNNSLHLDGPVTRGGMTYYQGGILLTSEDLYTMTQELFRGKNGALTKPRMGSFPTLTNKQVAFSINCGDGDFTLSQNANGTGQLHWSVDWNNHAVRDAEETGTYKAVMRALNTYKWSRGEGGQWFYDDEYARDASFENGECHSSTVSASYGPLGEKAKEDERRAMAARYRRR